MNAALGKPLPLSPRSGSLSEEAIYFSSLGWKERSGGGESPRNYQLEMWLPGLLSLTSASFSPTPIHFPSPTFLICTREPRRRHRLPRRSGGRADSARLGRWEERDALFWMPSRPAEQSNSIHPSLQPSAEDHTAAFVFVFFFFSFPFCVIRLQITSSVAVGSPGSSPNALSCLHVGSATSHPSPPH